jgi:predicted MPP superfamily phosphohydrolase
MRLRAVQLSDIHIGSVHNSNYLQSIVEKTNALNPDVVFITGDLVDGSAPMHAGMFDELKGLKAPAYMILGNHETYEGVPEFLEIVKTTGIPVLRDEAVEFKGVQIVGLDFKDERGNASRQYLKTVDYSKPTIVLHHIPVGVDEMKSGVMLSGHTHNGQIIPWNLFVRMAFKHVHGLYKTGDAYIYVSPGTGTWGPPMRLGSWNQITLLEFG